MTKTDQNLCAAIADRAVVLGVSNDYISTLMDIECVHESIPLRLQELLVADLGNFGHDVGGIARFLNRETRELEHCFIPRFAKPSTPAPS